ncbi:DUF4274 domain-containing protein [Deinococcus arenicola]|uniref:DUF4274 domain-containing protein n=1 Tax=Deinococcus arenicola TaxID=2994950 RepID=A0ABU4DP70_9DEIO|nr:DUF4274 domain-containing protein [Deinococcus sp. ZS9-10]MDV6374205.1 DUF4274 domain-containing protein [Deinococcus sp. ZS9-10]
MEEMETYARLMIDFLPTAPDDAWLWFACDSNSDGNGELIGWMIEQPTCPEAAALAIYWYSGAGYYAQYQTREQVPKFGQATFDVLETIQQRLLGKFYRTTAVGFDPSNDPTPIGSLSVPGYDWVGAEPASQSLPSGVRDAVPGTNFGAMNMPEGWVEGMPPEIDTVLEQEYAEEE